MTIPIKLKATELTNLVELLAQCIQTEECTDRLEAIIVTLLVKFYIRLKQRTIVMEKNTVRINVEPETAMAFVEFFNGYPVNCYADANTVNKLIATFDQQTASFFSSRQKLLR
jgi:hypothetical protein